MGCLWVRRDDMQGGGGRLAQLQKGESDVEQKNVVVRERAMFSRGEKRMKWTD